MECKLSRQVKGHHLGTIYNTTPCVVVTHHCDFIWAEDDVIIWTGAQILCKSLMITFPQQKVNKEKFPADRRRQPRQRQHAPTVGRLMCDLSKSCCQRAHCHAHPPDGVDVPICVARFSPWGGWGHLKTTFFAWAIITLWITAMNGIPGCTGAWWVKKADSGRARGGLCSSCSLSADVRWRTKTFLSFMPGTAYLKQVWACQALRQKHTANSKYVHTHTHTSRRKEKCLMSRGETD